MRTTEARQLLPDAWGYICPVHTPDGSPCGLLNHLTIDCVVSDSPDKSLVDNVPRILVSLGMIPLNSAIINYNKHFVVMLEGKVIGYIEKGMAKHICDELRLLKIKGIQVPKFMEIVLVPEIKVIISQFILFAIVRKFECEFLFYRMANFQAYFCLLDQPE